MLVNLQYTPAFRGKRYAIGTAFEVVAGSVVSKRLRAAPSTPLQEERKADAFQSEIPGVITK